MIGTNLALPAPSAMCVFEADDRCQRCIDIKFRPQSKQTTMDTFFFGARLKDIAEPKWRSSILYGLYFTFFSNYRPQ